MGARSPLSELTRLISNTTDSFTTALFFRRPGTDRYHLVSYYSLSNHIDPDFSFAEGEGFWGWVAKNEQPINISPFSLDHKLLGIYKKIEEIKSFLATPFAGGAGVLSVDSKATYVFTDKVVKLLTDFSHMAESLIGLDDNLRDAERDRAFTRMVMEIEARIRGGEALEIALESLREFLGAAHVMWTVLAEGGEEYFVRARVGKLKNYQFFHTAFSAQDGLIGWVYRRGQPLYQERFQPDSGKSYLFSQGEPDFQAGAFAATPARLGAAVYGALVVLYPESRALDAYEEKALNIVAALLGTAV